MKKIFAVGMSVLLLAGACAFAACDLSGESDGEGSSANQSQNIESGNKKRGTVTAEEWAQAMNLKEVENFTCKHTLLNDGTVQVLCKYDGLKRYLYHKGFISGRYEEVTDRSEFLTTWDPNGVLEMFITAQMEEFTYDEEKDCYIADHAITLSIEGEKFLYVSCIYMEIHFENGKLVRILEKEEYPEEDEEVVYTTQIDVYDYGTTVVTLPVVS